MVVINRGRGDVVGADGVDYDGDKQERALVDGEAESEFVVVGSFDVPRGEEADVGVVGA